MDFNNYRDLEQAANTADITLIWQTDTLPSGLGDGEEIEGYSEGRAASADELPWRENEVGKRAGQDLVNKAKQGEMTTIHVQEILCDGDMAPTCTIKALGYK